MKTKTIEIYQFNELSGQAKRKTLDNFSGINTEDLAWYETTQEQFIESCKEQGFNIDEIYFSGFCSQGDGASFTGDIDYKRYLEYLGDNVGKGKFKLLTDNALIIDANFELIKTSHRYSHENTVEIDLSLGVNTDNENLSDDIDILMVDGLCDLMEQDRLMLCNELYNSLESEYDYLTGSEAVEATLLANNYEFLIDGSTY